MSDRCAVAWLCSKTSEWWDSCNTNATMNVRVHRVISIMFISDCCHRSLLIFYCHPGCVLITREYFFFVVVFFLLLNIFVRRMKQHFFFFGSVSTRNDFVGKLVFIWFEFVQRWRQFERLFSNCSVLEPQVLKSKFLWLL